MWRNLCLVMGSYNKTNWRQLTQLCSKTTFLHLPSLSFSIFWPDDPSKAAVSVPQKRRDEKVGRELSKIPQMLESPPHMLTASFFEYIIQFPSLHLFLPYSLWQKSNKELKSLSSSIRVQGARNFKYQYFTEICERTSFLSFYADRNCHESSSERAPSCI